MSVQKISVEEALKMVEQGKIKASYLGRAGCGCGCRGTWVDSGSHSRRIIAAKKQKMETAEITVWDDKIVVSFDSEEKYIWFHLEKVG